MSSVLILDRPLYPTLITKAYSSSEFQKLFCYSSFMFFFSLCLYFILLQWKAICHSKSGYLSLLLPSTLLCNDLLSFSDFQMGGAGCFEQDLISRRLSFRVFLYIYSTVEVSSLCTYFLIIILNIKQQKVLHPILLQSLGHPCLIPVCCACCQHWLCLEVNVGLLEQFPGVLVPSASSLLSRGSANLHLASSDVRGAKPLCQAVILHLPSHVFKPQYICLNPDPTPL